jgi:hypothetical protein
MPSYHEIMTTDFSALDTAADRWEGMAKELHKQETAYRDQVHGISMGPTWVGLSAQAANSRFDITLKEFQKAQVEAKAVASLLREAHTRLTAAHKALVAARDDAVEAGMAVSEGGRVTFDTARLSEGARTAYHHDPDYQQSVRTSVASWQEYIDRQVKAAGDADTEVQTALNGVVLDADVSDGTLTGFNGQATGDIKTYVDQAAAAAKEEKKDKEDGWVSEGESEASGPDVGASATGPDVGSGKMGEAEAHADLGRASAEGKLTNGPMELAGDAEAYAGAKASAEAGISNEGAKVGANVFAGGEAAANGTAGVGPVGVYGRAEAKAGGEAGVEAGAGLDGVELGAQAFAGAKGSVTVGADVGGIGAGVTAEGYAGPGAEATVHVNKENGAWHVGAKAGVSPILGGGIGVEFTVDPGKVVDTVGDAVGAVGDAAGAFGDAIGSLF